MRHSGALNRRHITLHRIQTCTVEERVGGTRDGAGRVRLWHGGGVGWEDPEVRSGSRVGWVEMSKGGANLSPGF